MLVYSLIAIIIILLIFGFIIVRNLLIQTERLDDKVINTKKQMVNMLFQTIGEMRKVDERGAFEKDDEVGVSFKMIIELMETLTNEINGIE